MGEKKEDLKKPPSRNDEHIHGSHEKWRYSPIPIRCRGLCWEKLSHQTHYTCSAIIQDLLPSRLRIVDVSKRHNQKLQATAEKHFCLSQITHTYPQQIAGSFCSNFIISMKKQENGTEKQSLRKRRNVLRKTHKTSGGTQPNTVIQANPISSTNKIQTNT